MASQLAPFHAKPSLRRHSRPLLIAERAPQPAAGASAAPASWIASPLIAALPPAPLAGIALASRVPEAASRSAAAASLTAAPASRAAAPGSRDPLPESIAAKLAS
jgi:hypothetical protein